MSATLPINRVPPGQHAPFATVSEDDHRAWILIAAALGVAFCLVTTVTRIFIRWSGDLDWALDDSISLFTTATFVIQSSLVLGASSSGLGKSVKIIPTALHGRVQQLYYASNIFFLLALDLSKLASMVFVRRLTPSGSRVRPYITAVIGLLPVSTIAFLLAISLQCDISQPWKMVNEQCSSWFLRWTIQGVVSCLFELAMFACPVWLIWGLQAPTATRIEAITPFALRLIVIPITIVRLVSFDRSNFPKDPTLHEATYICWTQAELSYAVMAATFPAARRLIADLNTYYNGGRLGTSYGTDHQSHGQSFPMDTLRSNVYHTKITHPGEESVEDDGTGSQEMIIKRRLSVEVRNESTEIDESATQRPSS